MTRKKIAEKILEITENHINPSRDPRIYYAKEVTFDYGSTHAIRVDLMQYKPINWTPGGIEGGKIYCYEIKSCAADFKTGHGLNFIGDLNYIVTTQKAYEAVKDTPEIKALFGYKGIGLAIVDLDNETFAVQRKAKTVTRKYALTECLLSMFRSSNRETMKLSKERLVKKMFPDGIDGFNSP